jgi:glycosyltransferase involved in cell wall biosynthesis
MLYSFSIIIPVYNEQEILVSSVCKLINKLQKLKAKSWEIVLIENGSTDNSWTLCKQLYQLFHSNIKICRLAKSSYGLALKLGISKARYRHIVIFNVDYWDIEFLVQGLELIKNCDIVVGSKTLIAARDLRPFHRQQFSYWFNVFLRIVYNFPISDTHGIKVLKAKNIVPLAKKCYPLNELFDTQLILHACKEGLVYLEVPVTVREIRPSRYHNLKRLANVLSDLYIIFKYRYL